MKWIKFIVICCIAYGCKTSYNKDYKSVSDKFSIEILDDEGLQLISPNADIDIVASGFQWTEGPLWIDEGEYLLFSDIPQNKVYKLDKNLDTSTYLFPSGFSGQNFTGEEPGSNGLILDGQGRLVLLQHGNRQIARMKSAIDSPRPEFESLVSKYQGRKLNSPNDGVLDHHGNLYFTDPAYGLPKRMQDEGKELDFQGVFCLKADGELLLLDTLSRPNGIGLSPDQKYFYVGVSDSRHAVWYRYELGQPGEVVDKELFFDVTPWIGKPGFKGGPDGLKVNKMGYLFATGPGGVWIFNPKGKPIARIRTGMSTANCAFAYQETKLFMMADDFVLSVPLKKR